MKNILHAKHIAVIVLLVIHLLPIWVFKYFPSQDGPSHIYNAYILKDYHRNENYKIREVFKLNLTLFPNWTSHVLMALLMYVFPPIICEKILISLCIALLPISLFYFLGAVERGKTLFGLLGFIYAYNYLLHMGFYNFALSIPMFFFTLGYWWKHKEQMGPANIAMLYILLLGTYFCHYQSYLQLVLSLSLFAFFSYIYSALEETWGTKRATQIDKRHGSENLRIFVRKLKPLLSFLGFMLPAYFIMLSYYQSKTSGYNRSYWNLKRLKEYFFSSKSLVYFRDDHILIMRIMLGLLAVAFLLTLWERIMTVYKFRRAAASNDMNSSATVKRLWTRIINGKEQFLLMAGILTIIFFKSPWNLGSGGGWINDRVHIYIFLVLLPFLSVNFHRYIRYAMAGIIIALSLWHLGYSAHDYYYLSKEIADMTSSVGMLEEHTALCDEFDFVSCRTPGTSKWRGSSDYIGEIKYVSSFLHVPSYYCLKNDVAYLPNYEADFDYFPIDFKDKFGPVDYIAAWRPENDVGPKEPGSDYDLIHSGKYHKLYRLKEAKPDQDLWSDREVIKFDMQPRKGRTAPGNIAVFTDTVYTDGRYGWVTKSVRNELRCGKDIPEPYRDNIWGEEDGVFRVALPNGTYKVTCYFYSGNSVSQEVNIIANGKKVIKKLRMRAGGKIVEKSYTITVTDERLTQVIYTHGRGSYKRWGWSGCMLERI